MLPRSHEIQRKLDEAVWEKDFAAIVINQINAPSTKMKIFTDNFQHSNVAYTVLY